MAQAFYPGRVPIDAYGNGGFRFGDMSHKGSLLILPSGIYGWNVSAFDDVTLSSFEQVLLESEDFEFLLFGTGEVQIFASPDVKQRFEECNLGLDCMSTGAACRTYNVLLGEERAVAAALIAVP